jgi:hypothetical protein
LTGYGNISTDPTSSYTGFDAQLALPGHRRARGLRRLCAAVAHHVAGEHGYYDQLAQFDAFSPVMQSFFIETNLPTRYWGYLAVTTIFAIHICIPWLVLIWFVTGTQYTMLGETWQALAQASTEQRCE